MKRILALIYGAASYLAFLAVFLYAIGFVGNMLVPKSIDSAPSDSIWLALVIDAGLLLLFAVPHSVMARPAFKRWWTRYVPEPLERSTYVLMSSLLLALLFWQWRAIPGVIWHVENSVGRWLIHAAFGAGWSLALVSTFQIDHFDLFGLRQVNLYATGRPYTPVEFKTPPLYRHIRHPLMAGFVLAFWAAPTMTLGHLLFAVGTTCYILLALQFEERDLLRFHGEAYRDYQRRTSMLLPWPKPRESA